MEKKKKEGGGRGEKGRRAACGLQYPALTAYMGLESLRAREGRIHQGN